jgi:hypothetical protein
MPRPLQSPTGALRSGFFFGASRSLGELRQALRTSFVDGGTPPPIFYVGVFLHERLARLPKQSAAGLCFNYPLLFFEISSDRLMESIPAVQEACNRT